MDALALAAAFLLGLLARQVRLPPMVGFLLAGFVLRAFDHPSSPSLQTISDLVVLTLSNHNAIVNAVEALKRHDFQGTVIAIGTHHSEILELRALGVDAAFNLYARAGLNFASHIFDVFQQQRPDLVSAWRSHHEPPDYSPLHPASPGRRNRKVDNIPGG